MTNHCGEREVSRSARAEHQRRIQMANGMAAIGRLDARAHLDIASGSNRRETSHRVEHRASTNGRYWSVAAELKNFARDLELQPAFAVEAHVCGRTKLACFIRKHRFDLNFQALRMRNI